MLLVVVEEFALSVVAGFDVVVSGSEQKLDEFFTSL